jgi:hypothetical protein
MFMPIKPTPTIPNLTISKSFPEIRLRLSAGYELYRPNDDYANSLPGSLLTTTLSLLMILDHVDNTLLTEPGRCDNLRDGRFQLLHAGQAA